MSNVLEGRARRAAQRAGLIARKSRWRRNSCDNHGEFMLIEPAQNLAVGGFRYDMSAEDVIAFCKPE